MYPMSSQLSAWPSLARAIAGAIAASRLRVPKRLRVSSRPASTPGTATERAPISLARPRTPLKPNSPRGILGSTSKQPSVAASGATTGASIATSSPSESFATSWYLPPPIPDM